MKLPARLLKVEMQSFAGAEKIWLMMPAVFSCKTLGDSHLDLFLTTVRQHDHLIIGTCADSFCVMLYTLIS